MNTEAKSEESKGQEAAQKGELISIEIDKARKAGMNMLLPSAHIESLSELHSPILDYVDLSPEVSDGDVYYHGESKKLVLTKKGLMKLARAAGIVWHPVETRRSDNRADRNYVSYRALGGVRTADGAIAWIPGEYDLDLEVIEDELRDLYERKGKKSSKKGDELQGYVDYCVKRDLLYKRKHRVKLCETGAMTRVIRTLLVDLKPNQPSVNLLCRVIAINPKNIIVKGEDRKIYYGLLVDESGTIPFTAWDDFEIAKGDVLEISNAYTREWQGDTKLNFGGRTKIVTHKNCSSSKLSKCELYGTMLRIKIEVLDSTELEEVIIDGFYKANLHFTFKIKPIKLS